MSPSARRSALGSLVQSARRKQFGQVRVILIVTGALILLIGGVVLATVRDQAQRHVDEEIRKQRGGMFFAVDQKLRQEQIDQFTRVGTFVGIAILGVGALYLVFAAIVNLYPVPVTILALVIFVSLNVLLSVANPDTLLNVEHLESLVIRLCMVGALGVAVHLAIAHQHDLDADEDDEDDEDDEETNEDDDE